LENSFCFYVKVIHFIDACLEITKKTNLAATIVIPDHEPGIFLKKHALCHEHSPPMFLSS